MANKMTPQGSTPPAKGPGGKAGREQLPLDIVNSIVMMARPQRPELDDLRDIIRGFEPNHYRTLYGAPVGLDGELILQILKYRRTREHSRICRCRNFDECCENPANYES